jgi:hypothetical protein
MHTHTLVIGSYVSSVTEEDFNPLNAKLSPICHLLALLGAHVIFHVSGLRVKQDSVKTWL